MQFRSEFLKMSDVVCCSDRKIRQITNFNFSTGGIKILWKVWSEKQTTSALSFYGFKMIFDRPNHFGQVPIVLDRPNSFWSGPNHFGQVQIVKISPETSNLNLTKMIWTRPKQFGPDQNNLYLSKTIWTVQNLLDLYKDKAFTSCSFSKSRLCHVNYKVSKQWLDDMNYQHIYSL